MTVTDDRMQKRRDAFLMLTDEKPPAEPGRWLVVWGATSVDWGWTNWEEKAEADADAADATQEGLHGVKVHDLDAGW